MDTLPDIHWIDGFYQPAASDRLLRHFLSEHPWPENRYDYTGRQFVLPRLQTWHADTWIRYSYSHNLLITRDWTPLLLKIRSKVEAYLATPFNAVLVNYYRDGEDHVGWHADDELELGPAPLIASLTFGAERRFEFKHKRGPETGFIDLRSGTLLVMQPTFQHDWLHRVPPANGVNAGRINLTFRHVVM